jgi:hypothetical protein
MKPTLLLLVAFLTVPIVESLHGARSFLAMQKDILYDIPVSNHGARLRVIIKSKGIENFIELKSPQDVGFLLKLLFYQFDQNHVSSCT